MNQGRTPYPPLLEFSDFVSRLVDALRLSRDRATRDARLHEELNLDSLQMLELDVLMEEMGATLFPEILPSMQTIGDLFDHYVTRVSAEAVDRA